MKKLYFLFISLILVFGCKKAKILDLPDSNSPIFNSKGSFNNEKFDVTAGVNNCSLTTYTQINNGVKVFSGTLKSDDIEIEIGINDSQLDIPNKISINKNNLNPQLLSNLSLVRLDKIKFTNQIEISNIDWYSNDLLIGHNTAEINSPGVYKVRADVTFDDGSKRSLTNMMYVGYDLSVNFNIQHFFDSDGKLICQSNITKGDVLSTIWKIDNVYYSSDEDIEIELNNLDRIITCEVKFKNGAIRTQSFFANSSDDDHYIEDFSYFEENPINKVSFDGGVTIVVRKNGQEYRSDFVGNQFTNFQITNFAYYSKNSKGNDVYKFNLNALTNLKSVVSNTIIPFEIHSELGVEFSK